MNKLFLGVLALSFVLCLISCDNSQAQGQGVTLQGISQSVKGDTTPQRSIIKVAKKACGCTGKQLYEGARGGIYCLDTTKNGKPYKNYLPKNK